MKKNLSHIKFLSFSISFLASVITLSFATWLFFSNPFIGLVLSALLQLLPSFIPSNSLAMAVTQNTLIGRSRQKIGGTVMRTWKGLNILQSKPLTVANPNSDAQQARRSALRQLVSMFRSYLSFIRIAFNEMPSGTTQWAQLMKYNLSSAFTFSPPNAVLQTNSLRLSSGTLIGANDLVGAIVTGRDIAFDRTDNSGQPGASASDRAVVVALTAAGEIYYITSGATRSDTTMALTVPGSTAMGSFVYYFYFDNSISRKASDSQYVGAL